MTGNSAAVAASKGKKLRFLLVVLGLAALAVLLSLGTWQVKRLAWKQALIATISERIAAPPQPVADIEKLASETGDVDYWPVEATGRFLHESESHFFATWQGQSGYYVYTPFELADQRVVFVNRGFVPFDRKDPATRAEGQVPGQITIAGLARNRLAEKPSSLVPDNDTAQNIFYWKDLAAMTSRADLPSGTTVLPFFIDIGKTVVPGGLPVGGVTMVDLPNSHLQYAITWYGLAVALLGVLAVMLWRPRKGN